MSGAHRRRGCGGDDARAEGRVGSLMRHFLAAGAVDRYRAWRAAWRNRPGRRSLIAAARVLERGPPRAAPRRRASSTAARGRSRRHRKKSWRQSARAQMTNRSESTRSRAQDAGAGQPRGSYAKKGAANRALPGVMPPEGPGWSDSGPSPLSAVGGTDLPQLTSPAQPTSAPSRSRIPRFLVIVNTRAVFGMRSAASPYHSSVSSTS